MPYLESNFDLISPDLRGFGSSDAVKDEFPLEQMADDLAVLLDVLNIQNIFIVGHSMGGYVSLAFAHAHPERVLGLGLLGSQAAPDSAERKTGRYASAEKVALNGVNEVVGMAEKLSATPKLIPFFRNIILHQRPEGIIGGLKAMAGRPDATTFLPSFKFPVVLVHGQEDALIPPERSREMKVLLPQAELTVLSGVGHSTMLESPAETSQALLKLINQ